MLPLPDLLFLRDQARPDTEELEDLLAMAFLGRNETGNLHRSLGSLPLEPSPWDPKLFDEHVFLDEFIADHSSIPIGDRTHTVHPDFLHRVLARPPMQLDVIRFRQGILRELEQREDVRERVEHLYGHLASLLDLIRSAHTMRGIDNTPHRLAVLVEVREVVEAMAAGFQDCESGLRRIHDAAGRIKATREYRTLADLLAYEDDLAAVQISLRMGGDGRIKRLQIEQLEENTDNRFYKRPLQRWLEMLQLYWRGYSLNSHELVNRVIVRVYEQVTPRLAEVLTLKGHLEVYLTSRTFAATCRELGLQVCLADVDEAGPLVLEELFNPLLLRMPSPPVPCGVHERQDESVTLVTGPNSGGKTRLLQGIGLAQLLAQSGLYVPAARASVPLRAGLFASVVQSDAPDQLEGRLGRELLRIRTLFENIRPRSLVLLDELCSGTNPSEAAEIVLMVMRLLGELSPRAFITTHFLDLARQLQADGELPNLNFVQVEMQGNTSTYQFVPGVASTSMAAETARRLGLDFERLSEQIHRRLDADG